MSACARLLTERQYTDTMLVIGPDHVAAAVGGDAALVILIPILWILGVVVFIALKLRSR